jgi:hypothetical protein
MLVHHRAEVVAALFSLVKARAARRDASSSRLNAELAKLHQERPFEQTANPV